jgi:hypothetical protein
LPWRNANRQQTQQQIPTIEVSPSRISYGDVRLSDIDAYYLIENSGGISPTGGTEAVRSFNRLIERLDDDDNPVLVIVRVRE